MVAQSLSGIAATDSTNGARSTLISTPIVDFASGVILAQGIIAALFERERSGKCQKVSTYLFDTAVAMQAVEASTALNGGPVTHWRASQTQTERPRGREYPVRELLADAGNPAQGFGEVVSTNGLLAVVAAAKQIEGEVTARRCSLENPCGFKTYSIGGLCYSADNHDGWGTDVPFVVPVRDGAFVIER